MADFGAGDSEEQTDSRAINPGAPMEMVINRKLFDFRTTAGHKLRANQLKRKRHRREKHQQRVRHARMTELSCTELVRDGEVVNEIHAADEDRAHQHDGATADDARPQVFPCGCLGWWIRD